MIKRNSTRLACSVDLFACTTIDVVEARMVDVSMLGAQLLLAKPFPKGTRIHIDVEGDYYWGVVAWDEVDRMGVRFRGPVNTGALLAIIKGLQTPIVVPHRPTVQFGRRQSA